MQPIITSILDNDLYKFTMQNAVLKTMARPTPVVYQFKNRNKDDRFSPAFIINLQDQIDSMRNLALTQSEMFTLREMFPFFDEEYLTYLNNFRYDPDAIRIRLTDDDDLNLTITGDWKDNILWEVPLMALISEIYFQDKVMTGIQHNDYYTRTVDKYLRLQSAGCTFSDFGTRRRRSKALQEMCVSTFASFKYSDKKNVATFMGTSNVALAIKHMIPCIGTMAHEWIMGNSAFNLKHANETALQLWANVYRGRLGIALTDTFGTKAFFKDFDGYLARLYDGVRHDSGDGCEFTDKVVSHYESLGIDPITKRIVFSDGLNVDECIRIKTHCADRIRCTFGIGTNITNDVPGSKALNMVIKLRSVNGKEVVKISDTPSKATGDSVALTEAFKTFGT